MGPRIQGPLLKLSLNHLLYNETFSASVVPLSYDLCEYKTVYEKVNFFYFLSNETLN